MLIWGRPYTTDNGQLVYIFFALRVFLEPNKDLYDLFPHEPMDSIRSFLDNFKKISVGTKVYSIRAQRDPNDEGVILGDIGKSNF